MAPPLSLTVAFVGLTMAVVCLDLALVGRAAPAGRKRTWMLKGTALAILWMALHAGITRTGILERTQLPPPMIFYALFTFGCAVAIARSSLGARLAQLPLSLLVGLQSFRIVLEFLLHRLHLEGTIPVQMTWSGYNFDVLTGVGALLIGFALATSKVPQRVVWIWNVVGLGLLITVVAIAMLSTPLPFRQFHNEPAVLLPFHVPYNWIVSVHVWTALVGHLVIFRALRIRRDVQA